MPQAPTGKTKIDYHDSGKNAAPIGKDHTLGSPPSPRPGMGADPIGSKKIKVPKGQPPLRY